MHSADEETGKERENEEETGKEKENEEEEEDEEGSGLFDQLMLDELKDSMKRVNNK